MSHTSAILTINDIVDRYLLKFRKTTDDAVIYTEHAANCWRDFRYYHSNEYVTAKVTINANSWIEFPSDMAGFLGLYMYFNGRLWSFTEQPDIVNTTTFTGLVEGRDDDLQEGQPINHATSYGYGARGGVNAYNYMIDWAQRRIYVEGISSDTAILKYVSSGITVNGTTYVPDLLTPVIDNYLLYVETFWLKDLVKERESRKREYDKEVLKARNFINSLTFDQLKDLFLGTFTQGPQR
jgi:hypothetical protein